MDIPPYQESYPAQTVSVNGEFITLPEVYGLAYEIDERTVVEDVSR